MIVVPGGGSVALGYERGGTDVARALAQHGITAFVLKHLTLMDMQEAGRLQREHSKNVMTA